MSHFLNTFINRSLPNAHYVRRLWVAASDTALSTHNSRNSWPCVTPAPWVWAGLSDSLLANRIWHEWRDVATVTGDCDSVLPSTLSISGSPLPSHLVAPMKLDAPWRGPGGKELRRASCPHRCGTESPTAGWALSWGCGPHSHPDYSLGHIQRRKAHLSLGR